MAYSHLSRPLTAHVCRFYSPRKKQGMNLKLWVEKNDKTGRDSAFDKPVIHFKMSYKDRYEGVCTDPLYGRFG